MEESKVKNIIQNYLNGKASQEDLSFLKKWVTEKDHSELFKSFVKDHYASKSFDEKKSFEKFKQAITNSKIIPIQRKVKYLNLLKYAAIFAVILSVSFYYLKSDFNPKNSMGNVDENQIILTLDDGTIQVLSDENNGILTDKKGNIISRQEGNSLSYQNTQNLNSKTLEGDPIYNKIEVPNGKVFELTLSDGTHVWLNAGTKFKYPQKFSGSQNQRMVELEGEAFFDVTKNKNQPFIVQTSNINVKVLGTKFNVSAYKEDNEINTVLVEGSVNVFDPKIKTNSRIMVPNELAAFDKNNNNINVKKVSVENYTSWIENRLVFINEPFKDIIKKIERSYGVEIINEYAALDEFHFYGEFDIENIEDVLNAFKLSIEFNYEINNKTITIKN